MDVGFLKEAGIDTKDGFAVCPARVFCAYPETASVPVVITNITDEKTLSHLQNELLRRFSKDSKITLWNSDLKACCEETIGTLSFGGSQSVIILEPRRCMRTEYSAFSLRGLLDVMNALRAPGGCPWDQAQTHETLRTYLIQEAYEVADAIDHRDMENLKEELGDVLYQVVFHARIAEEQGDFTMQDVVDSICKKMIDRHPFVFSTMTATETAELLGAWEMRKVKAKHRRHLLAGLSHSLPSLFFTCIMQKKVSSICKNESEKTEEVEHKFLAFWREAVKAAETGGDLEETERRFGKALFAMVSLMRVLGIEPELALYRTNCLFLEQFSLWENTLLKEGRSIIDATTEDIQQLKTHLEKYEVC